MSLICNDVRDNIELIITENFCDTRFHVTWCLTTLVFLRFFRYLMLANILLFCALFPLIVHRIRQHVSRRFSNDTGKESDGLERILPVVVCISRSNASFLSAESGNRMMNHVISLFRWYTGYSGDRFKATKRGILSRSGSFVDCHSAGVVSEFDLSFSKGSFFARETDLLYFIINIDRDSEQSQYRQKLVIRRVQNNGE